jgi:putative transposase
MRGPTADNPTLTDENVRAEVLECLKTHLPLSASGYSVTTEMLLEVLLHAASTGTSVEAAADSLLEVADANTLRAYLNDQWNYQQLHVVESALNETLRCDLPRKVRRAKLDLACDTHDQPFYGKSQALLDMTRRGEARAGTTHFFRIASAYVMLDGVRITLAVMFVLPGHDMKDIVSLLLYRIRHLGLAIKRLWLDRGFATVEVFDYLRAQGLSAVIACPIRGKSGGTRALCCGRGSYTTHYTFHRSGYGDCRAPVAVIRVRPRLDKPPRWMIYVQIGACLSLNQVRTRYRRRFGIESSYRQLRQVRIRTNSRNPALRFIYMALALLLVNIWCLLRFRYCQVPRRGRNGRPIDPCAFKLRHLAFFLRQAIERRRGVLTSIQAQVLPRMAESVVH